MRWAQTGTETISKATQQRKTHTHSPKAEKGKEIKIKNELKRMMRDVENEKPTYCKPEE